MINPSSNKNGHPVPKVTTPSDLDNLWNLAPRLDSSQFTPPQHFAQFYETDTFLLDSLARFVSSGLNVGEVVIVVASQEHRATLEQRIPDLKSEPFRERYVALDASETLSGFMVDGAPDPIRFRETFESIIAQGCLNGRRVRIFGEMVMLLWMEGNHEAAVRLEELWNDLQRSYPFLLFCAYPMNGFANREPLPVICAEHTHVIPAESYTALEGADDRLEAIVRLQQQAKLLQAEIVERQQTERTLRAVTEQLDVQVKAREQLLVREQLARAEAERANRMKDEFLATVSHELRTPLNAIIGWCHMLGKGILDEETTARAFETIERNAKSQAQLVEDLLDVSRMVTGKLRLNSEPVDLASVINTAIDSVQLAADSKEIQLEVRLDPSARHAFGDPRRLQQVVWNLLSNAIKFTPTGGRVEVRLERSTKNVTIKVSDNGQGIEPDFVPFIFDRFRQADSSSTRNFGGLGLGLAIVRHLVELHGGSVCANSPGPGQGSTFTITLPVMVSDESTNGQKSAERRGTKKAESNSTPLPALDGVRVLLVDDNRDTLQVVSLIMTGHRANVQTAASAAEAIEVLEWYRPDIIVSDLAMPGEDGCSLISRIRELPNSKDIPTLALTSYVRVEDRARALSVGFNMFVPKPVEPDELVIAVATLTERFTFAES